MLLVTNRFNKELAKRVNRPRTLFMVNQDMLQTLERGHFDDAGKAFKGVALLYDDPAITPRALDKAAVSFRQAGDTQEADRLSRELRERYPNYVSG